MPVESKIFFIVLDDKFNFCFLLFLGDSICSNVCWYQILHKIKLLFHIPLLKYTNKWNMTSSDQAGGLNPVSKLVFVKIENNNLLCVVLITGGPILPCVINYVISLYK